MAYDEPGLRDTPTSMLSESILGIDKQLYEQSELISELTRRLEPLLNDKRDTESTADTASTGLYSSLTNQVLAFSDTLAMNNRRIRRILELIDV